MAQTHRVGHMGQFLTFAEKSRDFRKILSNRTRIRGVKYFAPPRHVGPVFSEFRHIQRNPSKRRKPTARATWISF